jgi:hypothetical protein
MKHLKLIMHTLLASTLICACATTNRTKTIASMLVAGTTAGIIGASNAPASERPEGHAALWAGAAASAAAIIGMFVFDEQRKNHDLEVQLEGAQKTLQAIHGGGEQTAELLYKNNSPFGKDVPSEYRSLIKPGQWSIYKLDQWTMQGENTLIHQDKMIKLQPPGLNPNVPSEQKQEKDNE